VAAKIERVSAKSGSGKARSHESERYTLHASIYRIRVPRLHRIDTGDGRIQAEPRGSSSMQFTRSAI